MPDPGVPTRASALVFAAKANLLRARRGAQDITPGLAPMRHGRSAALVDAPILATVRTALWSTAGGEKDRALNAGKIQNLRCALRGLDGIEVEAGRTLSFWRQVGRPTRGRGFVAGRELREGCMIATIGGGLCQLSNALYEAALQAGLEIVERHAHTRIVPGSRAAAAGRDATVFWNYLDLRVRGRWPFRIEARLTADDLELTIRGFGAEVEAPAADILPRIAAHDCLSCGQVTCHRHDPDVEAASPPTAWLVDSATPEFAALYKAGAKPGDVLHLSTRRFGAAARTWPSLGKERTADIAALRRALALLIAPKAPRAGLMLAADARLAAAHARRLSPDHTRLVVAQALLPHLWQAGVLQGRRFEVLMDRLPIEALHRILDAALSRHPDSSTLGDFRAPQSILAAEREALGAAVRLVTAHHAVAAHFPAGRIELLDWAPAPPLKARHGGRSFLFAGPALARKGAYAMREAMAGLDIELIVERGAEEAPDFWTGLDVRRLVPGEEPEELAGVVLPAIVEHRPHMLLRAQASDVPVIATAACGLPSDMPGLTVIAPDDAPALRSALIAALG